METWAAVRLQMKVKPDTLFLKYQPCLAGSEPADLIMEMDENAAGNVKDDIKL